jgi:signal transduction histidine kinase/ligand-binding sensor domain-containing protein
MPTLKAGTLVRLAALAVGLGVVVSSGVAAQHLPIKTYTTADGLPVDLVMRIKRDSHGFLWFCTRDGLSKFDGYQFTNYGKQQGLPHPHVNDLIESRAGTYWVATNGGGVCSFNPAERAPANSATRFKVYSLEHNPASNLVNRLCEDRQGRIWAGTDEGLFYFDKAQDRFIAAVPDAVEIYSLLVDRQGVLWIGASKQLWRRSPEGQLVRYSFQVAKNSGRIFALLEADQGKLWVGGYAGLFELEPRLLPPADSVLQAGKTKAWLNHFTSADGGLMGTVEDLYQAPDGHLWIVASPDFTTTLGGGLLEFDGQRFQRYRKAQGLTSDLLKCLAEDSEGNFWLGSVDGAMKITRNGFTTFGENDGLLRGPIAMFENKAGELCVITEKGMGVNYFADGRFVSTRFNLPKALQNSMLWGSGQITLQDRAGDWWIPTKKGLMQFPRATRMEQLAQARPKAHYLLGSNRDWFDIFRMFEDSRGDIWVGLASNVKNALVKWERASEKFRHYTEADGVPPVKPPTAFCEDPYGNLWIGLYGGGLLRYAAGRFTLFGSADGLPSGYICHLYLDRSKRLWISSSSDGLGRIDDVKAERPTFVRLTIANGLSSNVVYSVTEDQWGRIYIGTPRGVDRLNPVTGNIKRYTAADGLPKSGGALGFRDRHGAIWFSGSYELARLVPKPDEQLSPPPVLITGLHAAGIAQPIADLGETDMRGLELGPSQNHLQIEFVGLAFGAGETLQYQYKLEGADRDWQPLTALRTVNYANLAPRSYRFLVRAVNTEGVFSPAPAGLQFTVLAPFWRRWWFITLSVLVLALAVYADFRNLVRRRLALERIRARIAADLHDDIGANLTKITILSEVAHHQLGQAKQPAQNALQSIAHISRESVASMRDIVWAINPKRDRLLDLTRRMRSFCSDIFTNRNIGFRFRGPDRDRELRLNPEVRRDVFLIFKEAVNNIVRHSQCTQATIELRVEGHSLELSVSDDGKGIDASAADEGQGLSSMRRRAEDFGGQLEIISEHDSGTTVRLKVPIGGRFAREAAPRSRKSAGQAS